MRVAVLSDIHSNLEALEAVLADAAADRVVVLGDIVGYNADPNGVFALLDSVAATLIAGNHDLAVAGRFDVRWFNSVAAEVVRWTAEQLDSELLGLLKTLEPAGWDDDRLLVHGSVCQPATEYLRDLPAAAASFQAADFRMGLYGHTHVPAGYVMVEGTVGEVAAGDGVSLTLDPAARYLLNPGSVGQPRDHDPRASYLVLEGGSARWHRVTYDVETAMAKIRAAGLPDVLAERLPAGR